MNDERPPTLEELDDLPLGPAPVRDLLSAGHAVKRRRRVVVSSVLAAALVVAGVSVAGASNGPSQTRSVDAADRSDAPDPQPFPDPPAGSRWVGLGRVVLAVPDDWAVTDSRCDTASEVGILVVSKELGANASVDCGTPSSAPATVIVAPLSPGDSVAPLPESTEPLWCDQSLPEQCSADGAFPDEDVFVQANFVGPSSGAALALLDTATVLPDGWTTVPFGGEDNYGERSDLLEAAGFRVGSSLQDGDKSHPVRSDPAAGSPVREGTTITLHQVSPEQDPVRPDLRVTVQAGGNAGGLSVGSAKWDPDGGTVVYQPRTLYSTCLPEGEAAAEGTRAVLALVVPGKACRDLAQHVLVTISGLTEPPTELTVTEDGETRTVPVEQTSEAEDLRASYDPIGDAPRTSTARWDPRGSVRLQSAGGYACRPSMRVTGDDEALILVIESADDSDSCGDFGIPYSISLYGYDEPLTKPTEVIVTEDGETRIVPVR